MKIITVRCPRRGLSKGEAAVSVDADGFVGNSCKLATKSIIDTLGNVSEEHEKPELYQQEQNLEELN